MKSLLNLFYSPLYVNPHPIIPTSAKRNKYFKIKPNLSNLADQHSGKDKPPGQSSSNSAKGEMCCQISNMISKQKRKKIQEKIHNSTTGENLIVVLSNMISKQD